MKDITRILVYSNWMSILVKQDSCGQWCGVSKTGF
jgi:hypothetical protein